MDSNSINYDPQATISDYSLCIPKVYGCMDPSSTNYNSSANVNDGTCKYEGKVTFWYNSSGSDATVYINNQTGLITGYYPDYNPICGSAECANFTLPVGTYTFTAKSTWKTWSGSITIYKNGCTLYLLK